MEYILEWKSSSEMTTTCLGYELSASKVGLLFNHRNLKSGY